MPSIAAHRSQVGAGDQETAVSPTFVALLVSLERRIDDLAATAACADDDEEAVGAATELHRISDALHSVLGRDAL